MPRTHWPLWSHRPAIQVLLTIAPEGTKVTRMLLADTGAGNAQALFEILLDETDCLLCGGNPVHNISLGGAYTGIFPVYLIRVEIPLLGFDDDLPVVGVLKTPSGFDGIACFPFLNRFAYGNFGDRATFGLEA